METRIIVAKDIRGTFRVEIPCEARVTFGPAIPAPRTERGGNDCYALRVYKGATDKSGLLAVFPGVFYFHELNTVVPFRELTDDAGKAQWVADDGWFERGEGVASKLRT